MGKPRIKIDIEKCKGCMLCMEACPQKMLKVSDKVNKKGLRYIVIDDPGKCTGCGLCYMMCPDCSIEIVEEGKRKKEKGKSE
jgi:2-oxoglutarate ferredoxin oxidoreductase subunit delta